jgi:hypothetical protein
MVGVMTKPEHNAEIDRLESSIPGTTAAKEVVAVADRLAHFVYDPDARQEALEEGTPVTSVCGKVWVPSREPSKFPHCPTCLAEALRDGWMA